MICICGTIEVLDVIFYCWRVTYLPPHDPTILESAKTRFHIASFQQQSIEQYGLVGRDVRGEGQTTMDLVKHNIICFHPHRLSSVHGTDIERIMNNPAAHWPPSAPQKFIQDDQGGALEVRQCMNWPGGPRIR